MNAEWTLADLVAILIRRRAWIVSALALTCAIALLDAITATPRYRATAVIEMQKGSHGAFGLDNTTSDTQATAISDSFDDNLTLQTEIGILQSDALALDVIHRESLETTPDYFAPQPSHSPRLHRLLFWHQSLEPLSIPLADAPNRRYVALKIFAKRMKIAPAAGTRLISVEYSDPDPARSAAVVTALLQSLADYQFQSRSSSAAQSGTWLQAQLAGLRRQTDALDARAAALDRAAGDYGDDDAHNVVLARLDALNTALSAAQSNRIVREAIWRAVESGDPEVISGLGGNAGAGPNTQNSFALLQSLRTQEAVAQSQIAESAGRYGDNWPALAEQRAGLATIQRSIQDEVHRLGDRAHSDYTVSLQAETSARDAFDQQKSLASSLTGNAVTLRLARQEADASRTLYTTLLSRLQQTGVLAGLHSGNFAIVTPALVPAPDHPTSPNIPLLAALALVSGTTLGTCAALARELTDHTVHTAADLESLADSECNAPLFAVLPAPYPEPPWYRRMLPLSQPAGLALEAAAASDFALPAPASPFSDALHRLRANLLLAHSERAPQIITISSAEPSRRPAHTPQNADYVEEENPSLALSLATVLAQYGAPVLYVDADLRNAPPAGIFPVAPGLSDALAANQPPDFNHRGTPLLSVLHTGPRPPCPAELIASTRMSALLAAWRQDFRFIVIDSPPPACAEALVLAQQSDAVLLTTRAGQTRREAIAPALRALSRQIPSHAVIGLVLENLQGGPHAHA